VVCMFVFRPGSEAPAADRGLHLAAFIVAAGY